MAPTVSIIIPTITGREESHARCVASYKATKPAGIILQLITVPDRPDCGTAWNDGAAVATGEYLHITADDIEAHPGWLEAALTALEHGYVPSPVLDLPWGGTDGDIGPDGEPARMTPLPFLRREDWPGSPAIHYWSDVAVSERLHAAGHDIRWCHAYRFTHHRVQDQARRAMERRFTQDKATYLQETAA